MKRERWKLFFSTRKAAVHESVPEIKIELG